MGSQWAGGRDPDDFDREFAKMSRHTRSFMWALLAVILIVAATAFFVGYKIVMHFWW